VTLDTGHCITCGDTAVAATVVGIDGVTATVAVGDGREQVGIELVEPVAVGDLLLCHAGIALEKLTSPR